MVTSPTSRPTFPQPAASTGATHTRRLVGLLFVSTAMIAAAYASAFRTGGPPAWAAWAMIIGIAVMIITTIALGAARHPADLRRLATPLLFTLLVIVGSFGCALLLPAESAASRLVLGLPLRAAMVVYGVGVLPMLVLPLFYALTFEELTLSDADLARVRAAADAMSTRANQ